MGFSWMGHSNIKWMSLMVFLMGIQCDCMLWQGADSEIWKTWSEDEPKGLLEWWNFGVWDDVASSFHRLDYCILTPCSLIFVQIHVVYIDCIHVFDYFSHTPTTIFQTYWMTIMEWIQTRRNWTSCQLIRIVHESYLTCFSIATTSAP